MATNVYDVNKTNNRASAIITTLLKELGSEHYPNGNSGYNDNDIYLIFKEEYSSLKPLKISSNPGNAWATGSVRIDSRKLSDNQELFKFLNEAFKHNESILTALFAYERIRAINYVNEYMYQIDPEGRLKYTLECTSHKLVMRSKNYRASDARDVLDDWIINRVPFQKVGGNLSTWFWSLHDQNTNRKIHPDELFSGWDNRFK